MFAIGDRLPADGRTVLGVVAVTALAQVAACRGEEPPARRDWRADWRLAPGFVLERDAVGFRLPTSITFVPNPGSAPSDPLYFVTELRGAVKVVTNDRTVHTFAADLGVAPPSAEFPSAMAETGLAGLCLDPARGYVFVTFTYRDSLGALHNDIARFQSTPGSFSLRPTGVRRFTSLFAGYPAAVSHQIGPCQIRGDELFVSVGDAEIPFESQDRRSPLGKVLRLTVDGEPHHMNPYARDTAGVARYVWAQGFRNPFGLELAQQRLFVADNGPSIDRFLEIRQGGNYHWDGSDWSIGTNADVVLSPGPSPVQIDYYAGDSLLPSLYHASFFVATSGVPWERGPGVRGARGVIAIPYDFAGNRAAGPPRAVVRYEGNGSQSVAGLALGPDGLYFAPLFPFAGDTTPILRLRYARDASGYRWASILSTTNPVSHFHDKGCFGCHSLEGRGGRVGPGLDTDSLVVRVLQRLRADDYGRALARLDERPDSAYRATREWRADVMRGSEMERVEKWVMYRIMDPRFDQPDAQMPNLRVDRQEASLLARFLVQSAGGRQRLHQILMQRIGTIRTRHLAIAFVAGFAAAAAFFGLGWLTRRMIRRRRSI